MVLGSISFMLKRIGRKALIQSDESAKTPSFDGSSSNWTDKLVDFVVAIQELSGDELILSDNETVIANYVMYCENADISEGDRVVQDNVYYDIKRVSNPMRLGDFLEIYLYSSTNYGEETK